VYLQIYILSSPAYKVLLGRPFDTITESLVKNKRDGSHTLTLTDPNSVKCIRTRGESPRDLEESSKVGFSASLDEAMLNSGEVSLVVEQDGDATKNRELYLAKARQEV
jgi:hypothetical protein